MTEEWKSEWRRDEQCDAHGGIGRNVNSVHESGLVARHYHLKTGAWVCRDCWERARCYYRGVGELPPKPRGVKTSVKREVSEDSEA